MDKKTYLCRYHNLLEKIQKKKDYIAFCDERASSIPGQDFTTPRVDHTPSYEAPFVKWVIKAADAKRELESLEEQCGRVKAEIETAISKLEDETLQMILIYRYIDWLSWLEISNKVFWSIATVKRKHDKALNLLNVKSN